MSTLSIGFRSLMPLEIASARTCLAMTRGCVIASFFSVIASRRRGNLRVSLSLRAEGVAISVGRGIAELVPSKTRNLMLQFASATPRNRYRSSQ